MPLNVKLFLLLIALPLCAILLVNPSGNFPLNDDWAYALSVQHFVNTGHMQLSSWPAMSLVWQLIYSGLICKVIGFSFTHLRIITLTIALANNLVFYALFRGLNVRKSLAVFATLCIFFNPIYFNLAFTFMTEIHFLFWLGLSLLCLTRQGLRWIFAASIFASLAFLIRQHGLFIPMAFVAAQVILVMRKQISFKEGVVASLTMVIVPLIAYAAFHYWYIYIHGSTASYARKLHLFSELNWQQVTLNLWGSVSYLAWFVFPVTLVIAGPLMRTSQISVKRLSVIASSLAIGIIAWHFVMPTPENALASLEYPYRYQMPYLHNIVYNFGLGPITLKDVYKTNALSPTPISLTIWWVITGIVCVASILLVMLTGIRFREKILRAPIALTALLLLIAITALEVIISPDIDGGLFDRHILIYLLPMLILLLPTMTIRIRKAGVICLVVLASYAIAGTHDYLAWQRARWEGIQYLMTDLKIPADHIDAGIEFNGWYTSDTFPPQNNHFSYKRDTWWVVSDAYKVFWEMAPMYADSFTTIKEIPFTSWLHLGEHRLIVARRNDLD